MSSGPSVSAPRRGKKRSHSEVSTLTPQPQPQPSSQTLKAPAQPKETIDLTMSDEEVPPTVSSGSRATSTEPPIKFSLRPVYQMIDLTLESDEDKDVIGGMHAKSNPDPKGKGKEVVVEKKKKMSEKEIKRKAQLDHMAIMFTPAEAIAALANPKPFDIVYDFKPGERITCPIKRSHYIASLGRYLPPVAEGMPCEPEGMMSAANKKESTEDKDKGKGKGKGKAPAADDKASEAENKESAKDKGKSKGKAPTEGEGSTQGMTPDSDK
ncbi:hypothetical protein COCMIDRAFT_1330 [Bipolaris oryzae ATCC 44560]|uniref:Uncharacterized protein n=1 Tax=Bipolaris oryzae ATCC 44560 TaxID=930090 RepID=W6ZDL7_COCMI|nr:uncharacterized protein COCMIDRAFT_1330 [Bipolaris oryzae ATCC 44560]EUC49917.1 hypothetical protein COCMIDRAFT_1330 [Bipolaris oryzae ATCC 44560]